jgi:glycerophosphoryl diester phosphodiesterase
MKCGTGLVKLPEKGNKMKRLLITGPMMLLLIGLFSCQKYGAEENFDWQGHRGARGEAPENTIPAMLRALQEGVTTLEMDVVVSKDSILIVSHEPFFNEEICLFKESDSLENNIFHLSWDQIKDVDCGSKGNTNFPGQEKEKVGKPRLVDVISAVEEGALGLNLPSPNFNIEIKSKPEWEGEYHPEHTLYAQLLVDLIHEIGIEERVSIQSFDPRVLKYLHKQMPRLKLVYLTADGDRTPGEQISDLGFQPDVYSCYYPLLKKHHLRQMQSQGIDVIPWSVNDIDEAKRLIDMGVNGIITDYPAKLIGALGSLGSFQTD